MCLTLRILMGKALIEKSAPSQRSRRKEHLRLARRRNHIVCVKSMHLRAGLSLGLGLVFFFLDFFISFVGSFDFFLLFAHGSGLGYNNCMHAWVIAHTAQQQHMDGRQLSILNEQKRERGKG